MRRIREELKILNVQTKKKFLTIEELQAEVDSWSDEENSGQNANSIITPMLRYNYVPVLRYASIELCYAEIKRNRKNKKKRSVLSE